MGAGVAVSVEGLSGSLTERGHEVRVFALADRFWQDDASRWSGSPVTMLKVSGPAALGYAPGMLTALMDFSPDVTHLHGLWMHPSRSVTQWAQKTRRPYMISPHGMLAPAALAYSPAKKRIARMLYQDRSFRQANAFHATSDVEAAQIRDFGLNQTVELFPNGIELAKKPSDITPRKLILSLGRLHQVKGLDNLVDAWSRIEQLYPDWELLIAGPDSGGYAAYLQKLAETLGTKRIRISGPVYHNEKFRLMSEAAIFVLPSQSENFGLTVLESLLMGTPVIASQGTPWASLLERGCGDWVSGDASAFALAIEKLLKISDQERQLMGEAGRKWVKEKFSWPSVAEKAQHAYERMLRKK